MPTRLNWGHIPNGDVFEAFVHHLVATEDPRVKVFGRPGRDGGQDARSGDNKTVYQAKFIRSQRMTDLVSALKKKRGDIELIKQRRNDSSDPYFSDWRGVERWVVVSNVLVGPQDLRKWDAEIASLVKTELGLKAELWHVGDIEAKLLDVVQVEQAFFEGVTPAFIGLAQYANILWRRERAFRSEAQGESTFVSPEFIGRADALNRVVEFIGDANRRVLPVYGVAGSGKSRFLFEAAVQASEMPTIKYVYAALPNTLSQTDAWYTGLVAETAPGREILAIIDELPDPQTALRLLEQTEGGRFSSWKFLIAVRAEDHEIRRTLEHWQFKRFVCQGKEALSLRNLSLDDAKHLAFSVLKNNAPPTIDGKKLEKIAGEIAASHATNQLPLWITLLAKLVVEGRDYHSYLDETQSLASGYLTGLLENFPRDIDVTVPQLWEIVRRLALYQPVNLDNDQSVLGWISKQAQLSPLIDMSQVVSVLDERGVCRRYGVRNRMVEIMPDPIRDHLVIDWLMTKGGQPSKQALGLAEDLADSLTGNPQIPEPERLLRSLGRLEILTGDARLLEPTINKLIELVEKASTADILEVIAHRGALLAEYQPTQFAALASRIRGRPGVAEVTVDAPDRPYRVITRDEVVMELAWPLFVAATHLRKQKEAEIIFNEMHALLEEELRIYGPKGELPAYKSGSSAKALIQRMIFGGGEFEVSFLGATKERVYSLITALQKPNEKFAGEENALLEILATPLLKAEKEGLRHTGKNELAFEWWIPALNSEEERVRKALSSQIWEGLSAPDLAAERRLVLWDLLEHVGQGINDIRLRRQGGGDPQRWDAELSELITTTAIYLEKNPNMPIAELSASRRIWDWHLVHDQNPEIRRLAQQCERYLAENKTVVELQDILSEGIDGGPEDYKKQFERRRDHARELAESDAPISLRNFFTDALNFVERGSWNYQEYTVLEIARQVGEAGVESPVVYEFLIQCLAEPNAAILSKIARDLLWGWLWGSRQHCDPHEMDARLHRVIEATKGTPDAGRLVADAYARVIRSRMWDCDQSDFDRITWLERYFDPEKPEQFFWAYGLLPHTDWGGFCERIEELWSQPSVRGRESLCFRSLLEGFNVLFNVFHEQARTSAQKFEQSQAFRWLSDQLTHVPNLDDLGDTETHHLNSLAKRLGRLPIGWFVDFLAVHLERFPPETPPERRGKRSVGWSRGNLIYNALPHRFRLWDIVCPVGSPDNSASDEKQFVETMIQLAMKPAYVALIVPRYVAALDPQGARAPDRLTQQIQKFDAQAPAKEVSKWGRLVAWYEENSDQWRKVAIPIVRYASGRSYEDRRILYASLTSRDFDIRTGRGDELLNREKRELERLEDFQRSEKEGCLAPYWEWRIEGGKASIAHTAQWFQEMDERE